jgi:DNA-binding beta-propeller fold protein YncE
METETLEGGREATEERETRSTRRLLRALVVILALAAIALLALLIWLLWPREAPPPGQAAGYPIEVVTTIYGFGTGPEETLRTPLGVAFDGRGTVWISNTGRSRVEQYTIDGEPIRVIGTEDPGRLVAPYGLWVDAAAERVYVADYGKGVVEIFTTSGGYVGQLPAEDQDLGVFGEAFTPYDVQTAEGRIIVSSNDGLYFFDTQGRVIERWGGTAKGENVRGPAFGQFNFPDSFTVDPATGRIYVADTLNRRIVALSPEGKWLWVSGTPDVGGEIAGFWQLPRSIQLGPDGNLYVVDTFRPDDEGMGAGHISVLSTDGELLAQFGRTGSADGAFSFPDQIASDGAELWAIADRENHRVVIFRLRTPYPPLDDLEAEKYVGAVSNPWNVWSTSKGERERPEAEAR